MKIRSVTIFNGTADARTKAEVGRAGRAAAAIRTRLIDAGFEVQTTRLALAPSFEWMCALNTSQSVEAAQAIEAMTNEAGIDYVSLGPVADKAAHAGEFEKLPDLIAGTQVVFVSAVIAGECVVNRWALHPIAAAVKRIAAATENGFGNLRFAALAHCQPGIPFFPAAYAARNEFSCALAMECADVAQDSAITFRWCDEAMSDLRALIEKSAHGIEQAMEGIETETQAKFNGCDWSLAPHPNAFCSIGEAIESLSGAPFGECGTLSAIAALTAAIKGAKVRHVGFSGVFLPLLEDAILAKRTCDALDLQKLLFYCSVCGSGLDTVPLAGNVSEQSIAALLGDVATLAAALKKPLTARLMPVPGLKAGETTRFDFPYLVNGRTLNLTGGGSKIWDIPPSESAVK